MSKILCFGELLIRLSPQLDGEWIRKNDMPVFIGGAELNAATALAGWGVPVSYLTSLPPNYLSEEIIRHIESKGIGASSILFSGNRIGAYFLSQGTDMKNAGVIYDRQYSSFWDLTPGQINWDIVLQDISWFHFTAISPALNANVAAVCREAVEAASKKQITISADLNYRAKLWQYGKQPHEVMPDLVQYCDIIMGNIWAEEKMLAIAFDKATGEAKKDFLEQSERSSDKVMKQFPKCRQVSNTFRFDEREGIRYYATLYDGRQLHVSHEYRAASVIDKVGSGDTFMAGLIYGNYHGLPKQEIIDFAAAAAFNKLFIKGDASTATVEEIKKTSLDYA